MRAIPPRHENIELRHLRYFVAVAEAGSLSEAARGRLRIAQPALSRQIHELENELGVKLFERRPRGLRLTQSGERFLPHCREILSRLDEAIDDTQGFTKLLRVGCLAGVETEVLPKVTELAHRYAPEVDIQMIGAAASRLTEMLRAGELDMAITRMDEDAADLDFKTIAFHPIIALLPADHRLAQKKSVTAHDLKDLPQVGVSRLAAPALRNAIEHWFARQAVPLPPSHTAADLASGISLILTTHGFTLVPDYATRIAPPAIAALMLTDGPPPIALCLVCRPKNPSPARMLVRAIMADWSPV